jgi:DNA helicase HerA-like ATPase
MYERQGTSVYPLDPERCVGIVSEISQGTLTVSFYPSLVPANGSSAPQAAGAAAGEFLVIANGGKGIVGHLLDVKYSKSNGAEAGGVIGTVQPLLTLDMDQGKLIQGISSRPQIGNKAYSAHPDLVRMIADLRPQNQNGAEGPVTLSLGSLLHNREVTVDHTPETIFGRHCAVLGTSGGGKSWTVARLVEECANFNCKIILFDATGEFSTLSAGTRHVYLGNDPNPPANANEVSIPYYHLTETDLFAIFKPSGQSQGPKLRAAMKSLKLAMREPELALDGVIIKIHKSKATYEAAYRRHIAFIERPNAEFDISCLSRQIENECVHPNRSSLEPQFWGDINGGDQAACMPLIGRIEDIIHSPHLSTIFFPARRPSLLKVIDAFAADKESRVLRISLQHLSFAHNAREIISNAIGRHILLRARENKFRDNPMLLVVDEAHQFLNKTLEHETGHFSLDSFAQIAKEGRKYGLNICIATQRPRDIPDGVLSQIGTFIVHRLINDQDRGVVERASGEASTSTVGLLPTLAPGEAVLLGVDFPVALTVKMERPKSEPISHGPDYQKSWGQR